jgi:hypothetical protein
MEAKDTHGPTQQELGNVPPPQSPIGDTMSDDYERPFIEDGSQFGISQAAFAEMEPAEQRKLMIQWFFENFEDPNEPTSLEIYLDEPSDRYGSSEEREARTEALRAIENLHRTLQTRRPIGIGHNRPPDDTQQPEEISELPQALQELSVELQKPNPEISIVKRWATPLRNAVIASAKWTLKNFDRCHQRFGCGWGCLAL